MTYDDECAEAAVESPAPVEFVVAGGAHPPTAGSACTGVNLLKYIPGPARCQVGFAVPHEQRDDVPLRERPKSVSKWGSHVWYGGEQLAGRISAILLANRRRLLLHIQ
jgi:hypothetical protein